MVRVKRGAAFRPAEIICGIGVTDIGDEGFEVCWIVRDFAILYSFADGTTE